jgi:hypothetical protein
MFILFYYCYIFIVIIKSFLLNSEAAWPHRRVLKTNYGFTLVGGVGVPLSLDTCIFNTSGNLKPMDSSH